MLIGFKLFLYLVLAILSLAAFSRFRQTEESFWKGVIAIFAFLGIGEVLFKFLDIGGRIRATMQETGIYSERSGMQIELIAGVCVFVFVAILVLAKTIPALRSRQILTVWIALLIIATALEVISLHAIDAVFHFKIVWRITIEHIIFPALQLAIAAMLLKILHDQPAAEIPSGDSHAPDGESFAIPPSTPQSNDDSFRSF